MKIIGVLEKYFLNIVFVGFAAIGIANARGTVNKFFGPVPKEASLEHYLPSWWPVVEQTLYVIGAICLVLLIIVVLKRFLKGEKFVPFENPDIEPE